MLQIQIVDPLVFQRFRDAGKAGDYANSNHATGYLDIYEEFPISFNYSIGDIRNPENRETNYTKTITLPGTKNNNEKFGYIFDANIYRGTFNPNKSTFVIILKDSIEIFRGVLKLDEIIINDEQQIDYLVSVIGSVKDIYDSIGVKTLGDIDLSEYNHNYVKDDIVNSWNTSIKQNGLAKSFELGNGYVYPLIDYGYTEYDLFDVPIESWQPAVYVKTIIDKMFEDAGYAYKSDFFESEQFKKLVIPFSKDKILLTKEQVNQRLFRANLTSEQLNSFAAQGYTKTDTIRFNDDGGNANCNNNTTNACDTGLQYNPSTGKWTVAKSGVYNLTSFIKSNIGFDSLFAGDTWVWQSGHVNVEFKLVRKIGATGTNTILDYDVITYSTPIGVRTGLNYSTEQTNTLSISNVYLNAGDEIFVRGRLEFPSSTLFYNIAGQPIEMKARLRIAPDSYLHNAVVNEGITEGEEVPMNSVLPKDVSQANFLTSILRLFNLFIKPDEERANRLIIEPRNEFFNSRKKVKDWTRKLDRSNPIQFTPMSELSFRRYNFRYKEDGDHYNVDYESDYDQRYGSKIIDVDNDFTNEEKDVNVIFASTPIVNLNLGRRGARIVEIDSDNNVEPYTPKIRIAYYGGLESCSAYNIKFSGGNDSQTSYPYAGHFDDINDPENDLNWGITRKLYYGWSVSTDNNLYNNYWRDYIDEITDRDSKLLTGFFNLNYKDIHDLDFRDRIFVDGTYYRINRILDYDPVLEGLTEVELFKLKDITAFAGRQIEPIQGNVQDACPDQLISSTDGEIQSLNGRVDQECCELLGYLWTGETSTKGTCFWSSGGTPVSSGTTGTGPIELPPILGEATTPSSSGNIIGSSGVDVRGEQNVVQSGVKNTTIQGDNNYVGADTKDILILGSDNEIQDNVKTAIILGQSGITITQDGTIVLNDSFVVRNAVSMPLIDTVDSGIDEVQNPFSLRPVNLVDSSVDAVAELGSFTNVFKIDAGANNTNPQDDIY